MFNDDNELFSWCLDFRDWSELRVLSPDRHCGSRAGKFLVGYMAVGGEKEYYLASVCPELYAPPGAYISLLGLAVQGQFLGGKYDRI